MNLPTPARNGQSSVSGTVLAVVIAVVVCFTISAVVAIAIAVPEGANQGSLIALLLGSLAPTLATLVNLAKTASVANQVNELSNGLMDSKIRAGVADVIEPEHLNDDAADLIDADRARRRSHHDPNDPTTPHPDAEI